MRGDLQMTDSTMRSMMMSSEVFIDVTGSLVTMSYRTIWGAESLLDCTGLFINEHSFLSIEEGYNEMDYTPLKVIKLKLCFIVDGGQMHLQRHYPVSGLH